MVKQAAMVWGVVLLLVGILGWVPGITTDDKLLGLFMVSTVHNVVHLLTGLVALGARTEAAARTYFKVFGVVYALVAVVGFVQGDTVLSLFSVNAADNWLHVVIALIALYLGFMVKEGSAAPAAASAE